MKKIYIIVVLLGIIMVPLLTDIYRNKKIVTEKQMVHIGFYGDTMLGRLVNETIDQTSYAYPWGDVLPLLVQNDLNIINLETALTYSNNKVPKVFNFQATPDKVASLKLAHIDVCNIANNHILDFSNEGLYETVATLDQANIKHVGAGKNITQAAEPVIITHKDITIGIIGYTDNEPTWQATAQRPGTNYIEVGDIETIRRQLNMFKHKVDLVVVSIHWGPNMRERPTQAYIDFAHAIIDAGAHIIHGHSAHIVQGIELYKDGIIMYDTGDFVDDYAIDPRLRNDYGCIFLVNATKDDGIQEMRLIPTRIDTMQVNKAVGHDYIRIMNHIQEVSRPFGTIISDGGSVCLYE